MRHVITMIAAAMSALVATAAHAATPAIPTTVQSYLEDQGQDGFSGVILVARNGAVLERSYGLSDREFDIPNSPATRFRIGSLTKQFTAGAMLLLEQDGKLSLDDPLCKYVEPCPEAWKPIRLEQLLNHSSGITDFVRIPGMWERFTQRLDLGEIIRIVAAQPLDFAPGSDARYGNSGFLLSAHIIEKVSGKSYADFIRDRIYAPLAMADSGYAADGPIIARRAHGYVRKDGKYENAGFIDMSIPIGAGSQYSAAQDLYRWDRALRQPGLFTEQSLGKMVRGSRGFGLGWEIATEKGRRVIEHNGDINGFGSFIARYPDQDAAIIIVTNTEGTKVRGLKDAIAERLFGTTK